MQGREWPAINQWSFQHATAARCCVSDVLRRPCERKTSQSVNFKAFGTAHWDDGKITDGDDAHMAGEESPKFPQWSNIVLQPLVAVAVQ